MMNMKKLTSLALAGVLLTASLTGCGPSNASSGSGSGSTSQDVSASSSQPQAAGPFQNMDTVDLDGNKVDSSVFAENTLTMVNVWNLGCSPCIQEIPALGQLHKDYADKGVAVMGLYYNFGEDLSEADRKEIGEVMENAEADYPQILASLSMLEHKELGQIEGFPTTFFVDAQGNVVDVESRGKVVRSVLGSNDYEGWSEVIDKALEKVEKNG